MMAKDQNSSKKDKAMMLDPNRFKQAKSMAVLPGGTSNNDPQNVNSIEPNSGSFQGVNQHPYGDTGNQYAQMGTNAVFPAPASQMLRSDGQFTVAGTGLNAAYPYNKQPQPSSNAEDPMEGMRLSITGQDRGLFVNQFMGPVGQETTVAPGGVVPSGQQTDNTIGLVGFQSTERPSGLNTKSGKRGKA